MKYIALILALILCIGCLSGCGAREITQEVIQQLPVTEETQEPELGTPEPEPEVTTDSGLLPHEKTWTEEETEEPTPVSPTPVQPTTVTPQQEQPVTVTPQITSTDVNTQVEQIRAWYQAIVFDSTLVSKTFGDAATVYLQNGQIVSVAEYHQLNDAADPGFVTIHYYYRNGVPFFVFFEYENYYEYDEVRLYFADGELIRWIIDQNAPNDNVPNEMWADYYEVACHVYQNAQEALTN